MQQADVDFVANNSISRGIFHKQPEITDYSYCLEHEGKVLGIGGVRLITPTVAWGWLDITHYAGDHMLTSYRVIKEWMEILCKDKGIKRLQAYVDCSFPEAIRTVEHLGFEKEFDKPMRKFVGNDDAWLFVRFFE